MTTDNLHVWPEHRVNSFTLSPLGLATALTRAVEKFARAADRWRRIRADREVLMSMSDRMLQDIGVQRAEIDYVLRYGREVDRFRARRGS